MKYTEAPPTPKIIRPVRKHSDPIQEGTDVMETPQLTPSSPQMNPSRMNKAKAKILRKEGCWRGSDSLLISGKGGWPNREADVEGKAPPPRAP